MDNDVVLAEISLTHVEYVKGDLIGCVLAWFSLVPIFLIVSFATLIVFLRDLHTMFFFMGILANEAFNLFLKYTIKDPRPPSGRNVMVQYGMPSSHAQFMAFFSAYFLLFLVVRVQNNGGTFVEKLWKHVVSFVIILVAYMVSLSRVYLRYHTFRQVVWGNVVGVTSGATWFLYVHTICTPFFPIIASWPVSELFLIRDCSRIPNVMWFSYASIRGESRKRGRRNGGKT